MTPLDRLRDAVETFLAETAVEGTLDGFVLLAQTSLLDPDVGDGIMPRAVGEHYATDLPAPAGLGLADGFAHLTRKIIAGSMRANGADG